MSKTSYSKTIHVQGTPDAVFKAITEAVDQWWTIYANKASTKGDVLSVTFEKKTLKEMCITALEKPNSLTWEVTHASISEWIGTQIMWTITASSTGSTVVLTHKGLTPDLKCYEHCEYGWNRFLTSLQLYVNTGKGEPYSGTN